MLEYGWFLNEKEVNDSFLFAWIDNEPDGTESVTVALLMKDKLIDHLNKIGWTRDKLLKKAKDVRYNPKTYKGNLSKDGCVFSFPKQLPEQPVNILLPRKLYMEMAELVWKKKLA